MKNRMKENVSNAYLGNIFFPDFVNNSENSFSKSTQEFDEYSRSKKPIGELNQVIQSMGMKTK